jgi:hypothetical protein
LACQTRERTGRCTHAQCPHSTETAHGYECIDIVNGFCEVGDGCLPKCQYSWQPTDQERAQAARKAFEEEDLP